MNKQNLRLFEQQLFSDIQTFIEETRQTVSQTVNTSLTLLYWNIGKRVQNEVLKNDRLYKGSTCDLLREIIY